MGGGAATPLLDKTVDVTWLSRLRHITVTTPTRTVPRRARPITAGTGSHRCPQYKLFIDAWHRLARIALRRQRSLGIVRASAVSPEEGSPPSFFNRRHFLA